MRLILCLLTLAAFLLTACSVATPEPLPTAVPENTANSLIATSTPLPQRAPVLRIAVLGEVTTTNVWTLFDESGADYWNMATQAAYWPTLYRLAPPSLDFRPAAAQGNPSPVNCDAAPCTATVTLQPGLTWTDGSSLTADDVAFTVNTALQFRLGLNWKMAYNPDVLDHAEAVDETTVEFHFTAAPTAAEWQYGTLLGPIVNRAYWQPRIARSVSLLPDETLLPTIQELEAELATMQADVDALNSSLNTMAPASTEYQDTAREAKHLQDDLNSIYNKLQKNQSEYETNLSEARASLFELANANEPTLGPWKFASHIENEFENQVNIGTPFGDPWFDSIHYRTYPDEFEAVSALRNGDADIVLLPDGLSPDAVSQLTNAPGVSLSRNITRSARFLAFNHANPYLADPVLHQALACMLEPQALVENLDGAVAPLSGFVLDEFWRNRDALLPCDDANGEARLAEAVRLLKSAGYVWDQEPVVGVDGSGLQRPDGFAIPTLTLLTPEQDDLRDLAAQYIARQAKILGLTIEVQIHNTDDLLYSVYGSRNYDMALLGWRLSAYPSYLCDWFLPWEQNPFVYSGSRPDAEANGDLKSACEAWAQTNDLDTAKSQASEVQSILMRDLPLIPLYSGVRIDGYRNIRYPFSNVIDGLGGLYGATVQAVPIP